MQFLFHPRSLLCALIRQSVNNRFEQSAFCAEIGGKTLRAPGGVRWIVELVVERERFPVVRFGERVVLLLAGEMAEGWSYWPSATPSQERALVRSALNDAVVPAKSPCC